MNRLLAMASGLFVGGFLFHQFGYDHHAVLTGWPWYQGAVVLAASGLAGLFPAAWLSGAIALAISPTLIFCYEIVYLRPAESMWPVVLPLIFLLSLPAPLIGASMSKLVTRIQFSRAVYFAVLAVALTLGTLLPILRSR